MILVFKKGHKISEEQKRMMRKRMTGKKNPFYGKTHSEKTKKMLRERVYSEKTRKKIGLAGMGRKLTEKAKKAIGLAQKGKKLSEETKQKRLVTMKKRYPVGKFPGMPGHVPWHKGKTGVFSDKAIEKIRKRRAEQKLPVKDTWPEKQLQNMLNDHRIPFVMQKNFHLGFQQHQVDIFIEPNICIEVDGDYFHGNPHPYPHRSSIHPGHKPDEILRGGKTAEEKWGRDRRQTEALEQQCKQVVKRFWQSELETEPKKCLQKIIKAIKEARR